MGKGTAISWATDTFNLWWGCEHASRDDPDGIDADPAAISEECRNCYAETFDKRVGGDHWGPGAEPRWFGDAYWAKLRRWNTEAREAAVRRRVFVASMADWAQRHRDPAINAKMDAVRMRMWREVRACRWLDFLFLTKRAERLPELLPWHNLAAAPPEPMCRDCADKAFNDGICESDGMPCDPRDPWPNVWVGVTAGTRRSLWRVDALRKVRAAVHFISCEPLLEHITAEDWDVALGGEAFYGIEWLIVGDESGGTKVSPRRPVDLDAVRTARDAAERHGVAFHLKQLHEGGRKVHLPMIDRRRHAAFPGSR